MMSLVGFPLLLLPAYLLGIGPSLVYMLAMELWFKFGMQARLGLLGTAAWSGLLGSAAGFSGAVLGIWLGLSPRLDGPPLALYGALIGLAIGCYVGKQPRSAA